MLKIHSFRGSMITYLKNKVIYQTKLSTKQVTCPHLIGICTLINYEKLINEILFKNILVINLNLHSNIFIKHNHNNKILQKLKYYLKIFYNK